MVWTLLCALQVPAASFVHAYLLARDRRKDESREASAAQADPRPLVVAQTAALNFSSRWSWIESI